MRRNTYYFELWDGQLDGAGDRREKFAPHTGAYLNRAGFTPVQSFSDAAELVSELAKSRKSERRWRDAKSQEEVAQMMGKSRTLVARVETEVLSNRPRNPRMQTIRGYASALGYDVRLVCIPRKT